MDTNDKKTNQVENQPKDKHPEIKAIYLLPFGLIGLSEKQIKKLPKIFPLPWWKCCCRWFWNWRFWCQPNCCCCCTCDKIHTESGSAPYPAIDLRYDTQILGGGHAIRIVYTWNKPEFKNSTQQIETNRFVVWRQKTIND